MLLVETALFCEEFRFMKNDLLPLDRDDPVRFEALKRPYDGFPREKEKVAYLLVRLISPDGDPAAFPAFND